MRSCILLLAATLAWSADVELSLTNGRTVRGEVVTETDTVITLRSRFPARGAAKQVESVYVKADIIKRKDLPSPLQQYEERKARTPDTVPEQCTLAQWAYENCLREQARSHALRVLELDAENAWARRILDNCGYIEVSGRWIDEAEYFRANNLVRVDGEIIPVGLADDRKAYLRARGAWEVAKRKLDEAREIATSKSASASAAEAKGKEAAAKEEALKKVIEEAEAALAAAKEQPAGRGDDERKARQHAIDAAGKRLAEAREQSREARKAAEAAKRSGSSDKAAAERAKAAIAELEAAAAKAEAEMKAAAAKLPADDKTLKEAAKPEAAPAGNDAGEAKPEQPQVRRLRGGGGD